MLIQSMPIVDANPSDKYNKTQWTDNYKYCLCKKFWGVGHTPWGLGEPCAFTAWPW